MTFKSSTKIRVDTTNGMLAAAVYDGKIGITSSSARYPIEITDPLQAKALWSFLGAVIREHEESERAEGGR